MQFLMPFLKSLSWVLLLAASFLLSACGNGEDEGPHLPVMQLDSERLYVAGVSSGGSMAQQLHLAWPEEIQGVAVFTASPYACARDGLSAALFQCMATSWGAPRVHALLEVIQTRVEAGQLGGLNALQNTRAYLYQAGADPVIQAPVTQATLGLYQQLLPTEHLASHRQPQAGHGLPTVDQGVDCARTASPFVNACGYSGASASLDHLDDSVRQAVQATAQGTLELFNQRPLSGNSKSLEAWGYYYVPPQCATRTCGVTLVLHGCEQGAEAVGTDFIKQSGYLQQADARDLVMVFPQIQRTLTNPKGCWDWWGYESSAFDTREGSQIQALRRIWQQLLAEQ